MAEEPYPIAIIATARHEGNPTVLGDVGSVQEINLDRLSSEEIAALAARQLKGLVGPELLLFLVVLFVLMKMLSSIVFKIKTI